MANFLMTIFPMQAFQDFRRDGDSLNLDAQPLPTVAIDLDAGEIIATNVGGSKALGLFEYASYPIALDRRTPALSRLRELADAHVGALGPSHETLSFWSNGRVRPLPCAIIYDESNGRRRVLLHLVDAAEFELLVEGWKADAAAALNVERKAQELRQQQLDAEALAAEIEKNLPIAREQAEQQPIGEEPAASPISDAPALPDESPAVPVAATSARATDLALPLSVRSLPPSPAEEVAIDTQVAEKSSARDQIVLGRPKSLPVLDPDYLAKLAHELKTPLSAIAAAAEVMRDERLGAMGNERYRSYASDIHESAAHALDLISNLLSDSRRPSDSASRLIALDLNALVARTVSSVQALADQHSLKLTFDAAVDQPHVVANPTAIRQILLNLLTNAIKFTPAGGAVRAETGFLPDGRVFMAIRDTGCGMGQSPDKDHATAINFTGASFGIGLPLVRKLVREMSADIQIESEAGKGTTVLIAFGDFARWSV